MDEYPLISSINTTVFLEEYSLKKQNNNIERLIHKRKPCIRLNLIYNEDSDGNKIKKEELILFIHRCLTECSIDKSIGTVLRFFMNEKQNQMSCSNYLL